jgi:hypothetical protein
MPIEQRGVSSVPKWDGHPSKQSKKKRKKKQTKKKERGTQDRKESTGRIAIQIYNRRVNGRRMSEQERR